VSDEFEQIGGRLKAAREAFGLSLDDVQFRTQLPRSVLEALEADHFSAFASPVYAKSFLGQYSSFLNVDAQTWLDALEPGGFIPGGLLQPIVKVPEVQAVAKPAPSETRGGLLPIAGLLLLSGGVIYFAIKGYDSFEARFGAERRPQVERPPSPAAYITAPKPIEKKPAIIKEEEDLGKPPPRAIIVR